MEVAAAEVSAKTPAPSNVSSVIVEGARSAEPPISQGILPATALSTLPAETRLAIPLASAGNVGKSLLPAGGQLAGLHLLPLRRPVRDISCAYSSNFFCQAAYSFLPRLPTCAAKSARTSAGTRNFASAGQP